jgi:mTERF
MRASVVYSDGRHAFGDRHFHGLDLSSSPPPPGSPAGSRWRASARLSRLYGCLTCLSVLLDGPAGRRAFSRMESKGFSVWRSVAPASANAHIDAWICLSSADVHLGTYCLRACSVVLSASVANAVVIFVRCFLSRPMEAVLAHPAYLGYSLERRIAPRVAFLQSQGKPMRSLSTMFGRADADFATDVAKARPEDYDVFKRAWLAGRQGA